MKRQREMERRTAKPSTLPTHRTFKNFKYCPFSLKQDRWIEKKALSYTHTPALRYMNSSTHTFTCAHAGGKDSLSEFMD